MNPCNSNHFEHAELHFLVNDACMHDIVEAMTSKIILMMPKNQELSKFQRIMSQKASRIKFQDSRTIIFKIQDSRTIKFQESRFKNNQDQDSRIKRRLNQDKY